MSDPHENEISRFLLQTGVTANQKLLRRRIEPAKAKYVMFSKYLHYSTAVYIDMPTHRSSQASCFFPCNISFPLAVTPHSLTRCEYGAFGCNLPVHKLWSEEIYHPALQQGSGQTDGLPANKSIGLSVECIAHHPLQ